MSRTPGVSIAGNTFLLQYSNKLEQSASFQGWGHPLHVSTSTTKDLRRRLRHSGKQTCICVQSHERGFVTCRTHRDWVIAPMVRALLTAARESRGQFYIVFRETSTQHFLSRRGGCYDGELSKSYRGGSDFCCGKLDETEAIAGDWRNRMYQEEFRRQDPHWERHVGWLPFFNTTLKLYDMHLEVNNMQRADCLPSVSDVSSVMKNITVDYKLIKGTSKKIYMMHNGRKRLFTDWNVFVGRGLHSFEIEQIAEASIDAIPDGPVMTME
eukprot:gene35141-45490_t